jgi:hypothetical protein
MKSAKKLFINVLFTLSLAQIVLCGGMEWCGSSRGLV